MSTVTTIYPVCCVCQHPIMGPETGRYVLTGFGDFRPLHNKCMDTWLRWNR